MTIGRRRSRRPVLSNSTSSSDGDGVVSESRILRLGTGVTAGARCQGRASVHPGNDALCRPRVLCVGWSERLLKDGLLNGDPIAERGEIRQNAACEGPPVRERQSETEVSEQRAGVRRMTKSRIDPGPYECVTFSNLDATREEDSQGMNGRPANSDAGEHESQTGQLERSIGTIHNSVNYDATAKQR